MSMPCRVPRLLILLFLFCSPVSFAQNIDWTSTGIGGGGALFSPSINPNQPAEVYLSSDLGAVFHSIDYGNHWTVTPFWELSAAPLTEVQFSGDRQYALKYEGFYYVPVQSVDGGESWESIPSDPTGASAWFFFADPDDSDRLLLSSYDELYFSDDGGNNWNSVYSASDLYIGGVFWNGPDIFIGCRTGLLVSEDAGQNFELFHVDDNLPADYGMLSFCGGFDGSKIRLYCVARNNGSMWPGMQASEYWGDQEVFVMDWTGDQSWTGVSAGIGTGDFPFFVDMARNQTDTIYVAGTLRDWGYPMVWKSTDGGMSWSQFFEPFDNANVYTGWQCEGGDQNWWWGGSPLGFEVAERNSDRVVFTDYGFVHKTNNGGQSWQQGYVDSADQNMPGDTMNEHQSYRSNGLEPTTTWWLHRVDDQQLFAGFSDITGIRSEDDGQTWSFDYSGNTYNTTYQIISPMNGNTLYAAVSSAHDIYQSTYLTDDQLDGATGEILFSTDGGSSWNSLYNVEEPVVWMAIDPNDPNRMYVSVVNSEHGGIYSTTALDEGSDASWFKLNDPPRTEGHPYNIRILDDGTLVTSWSARRNNDQFTLSSGIFVSEDQGQSWTDRSIPEMERWTKDVVIDPHDQDIWYACVFSHWGDWPNEVGGLYRTDDRGQSWSSLGDFYRVESCTVHPEDSNILFVTTESEGLWYTDEARTSDPEFQLVESYPFEHPLRVFFEEDDPKQLYICSYGNGLKKGMMGDVTHASDLLNNRDIKLYPNPVKTDLNIVGLEKGVKYIIEIFNTKGQLQRRSIWINGDEYSVDKLDAGLYRLFIKKGGRTIYSETILKE